MDEEKRHEERKTPELAEMSPEETAELWSKMGKETKPREFKNPREFRRR